jgi:hypothetical protein
LVAVVILILLALAVFPGFVAGTISRTGHFPLVVNGSDWNGEETIEPSLLTAEQTMLAPSDWLMNHSAVIRRFYMWQYRLAGGIEKEMQG